MRDDLPDLFERESDGSYALASAEGYGDPFHIEVDGRQDSPYRHELNIFWNERHQLIFAVWNQSANVQGAAAKTMTMDEAKRLLSWLKRTIAEHEGV